MTPTAILADLVAIPGLPGQPNGAIVDYVRARLLAAGAAVHVLPGPEGDRANVFATIGPADRPGIVLSGHMDVVPIEGQAWTSDPFRLTQTDGRLVGRGTTDMKGFLACVLAMAPDFAAMDLARPVHVAFSYDEEIGCRGAPHLVAALPGLCAPPSGAIVGEPSDMAPVLAHKGKAALEIVIEGVAGHSSDPAAGENALYPAGELLVLLRDEAARLAAEGPFDPRFSPPHSTLQAGLIRGGAAVNIIPDRCVLEVEARAIPAQPPRAVLAPLLARLDAMAADGRRLKLAWRETAAYPHLAPAEDPALAELLTRLTGRAAVGAVSYGTEAGLFQAAGVPAIICGPGSIARAHRPDEHILPAELEDCRTMLRRLGAELSRA
jgi:acetylornithine deacetylase